MQVDFLGNGLTVVIQCEANGADNFLAFASWYSLTKNLPDAEVIIVCQRPTEIEMDVFPWVYRVKVPFFYYQKTFPVFKTKNKVLTITPDIMCLGSLDKMTIDKINANEDFVVKATNPEPAIFCSLKDGCGSFVPANWIHKRGHPFDKADVYLKGISTINEKKVFLIWKKLCPMYNGLC